MDKPCELVALQMTSVPNIDDNLAQVETLLAKWNAQREDKYCRALVVLPECFAYFGGRDKELLSLCTETTQDKLLNFCKSIAIQYEIYLVTGSMPSPSPVDNHAYATSYLISPNGNILGTYHKMHLFDVKIDDEHKNYAESKYTLAGDHAVSVIAEPGHIGLSICYDLRFSALYNEMSQQRPLDIIALPAAFTYPTGRDHWHYLLAARAIEQQSYIVAAGQTGLHANGRRTYGHSAIYSPWGEKLAELKDGTGFISHISSPDTIAQIRRAMPVHSHRRSF